MSPASASAAISAGCSVGSSRTTARAFVFKYEAKPPSAELKPNQKDTDTLPEYSVLDPLIEGLVDLSLPPAGAARRAKAPLTLARDIARRIDRNEYKRRQAAPGPKITARAFGEGRRYPIAQKFRV